MSGHGTHGSVRLAWSLANLMAARSESMRIEPLHFFLALLHVLDDLFHEEAERIGLERSEIEEVERLAGAGRERIGASPRDITKLRRALVRELKDLPPDAPRTHLHRSDRARGLFDLATELMQREGAAELTLVHLADALMVYPSPDLVEVVPGRGGDKPDLAWETRINRFVDEFELRRITVVMTDIEGSTSIKTRFGDVGSAKVFRAHDNVIRQALTEVAGAQEFKSTGDGFLLGFADDESAVRVALRVQARLRAHDTLARVPVKIRIGIHSGEILSRVVAGSGVSDPVFGVTIDTAARVMSLGVGDQILVDEGVWSRCADAVEARPPEGVGAVKWMKHGDYELKGVPQPVAIYEVGEVGAAALRAPGMTEKARPVRTGSAAAPGRSGGVCSSTPAIDLIGRDLSAMARSGSLPPFVQRRDLVKRLARHLQRTAKRNVMVVGDAGVGKSAVVEGFAAWAASPEAHDSVRSLRVVQINVSDLVSGTRHRGDMEERVSGILKEATANPDVVLFLDEIHLVFGGGEGMNIANLLKPALARDDLRCIGATTTAEFERLIKHDTAFTRRFQILRVPEPSEEEALEMVRAWAERISGIQELRFSEEALAAAVHLTARLIRDRVLPDKAIDLLENVATHVKVTTLSADFSAPSKTLPVVGRDAVERVLEEEYGVSASAARGLQPDHVQRLLEERLVGQGAAVGAVVSGLKERAGAKDADRPMAIFLLTGPTGVGKTYTAECLAAALEGPHGPALCRLNMSEFKEGHQMARLTGAPPGFVGHEQPGALFRYLEGNPQGVILLDEMEKAHPEVHDWFLQVFDKGEALDSRGRTADFRRQIIVMTANVLDHEERPHLVGFGTSQAESGPGQSIHEALLERFRPEFLGRVDRVVPYRQLDAGDYRQLLERRWIELTEELADAVAGEIILSDEAATHLCVEATELGQGVRGFDRIFGRDVRAPLLDATSRSGPAGDLTVGLDEDRVQVR